MACVGVFPSRNQFLVYYMLSLGLGLLMTFTPRMMMMPSGSGREEDEAAAVLWYSHFVANGNGIYG